MLIWKKDGLYIQNNINLFIYLVNNHTYIWHKIYVSKMKKGKKKKGYNEYTAIFLSASPAVLQWELTDYWAFPIPY